MNKKSVVYILILLVLMLVIPFVFYQIFRNDSDLLEYMGAIYGGVMTVISVGITIDYERQKSAEERELENQRFLEECARENQRDAEERARENQRAAEELARENQRAAEERARENERMLAEQKRMYENEYRPQFRLVLSDRRYDFWNPSKHISENHYTVIMATQPKPVWDKVSGVIPLQIRNIGKSDIVIEKVEFATGGREDEPPLRTGSYKYTKAHREDFTVYSQESFDAPVRMELEDYSCKVIITYHAIMGMDKNTVTPSHTKTYSLFVPARQTYADYDEWVSRINISRRS